MCGINKRIIYHPQPTTYPVSTIKSIALDVKSVKIPKFEFSKLFKFT